jgi:hypothetical protein
VATKFKVAKTATNQADVIDFSLMLALSRMLEHVPSLSKLYLQLSRRKLPPPLESPPSELEQEVHVTDKYLFYTIF